jgi:hypothetical protein
MITDGKTGTLKQKPSQGNPSGSIKGKTFLHAQRIGAETLKREYNAPTSHRHLEQVKRYAELIRNYKNQGIKSLWGNKLDTFEMELYKVVGSGMPIPFEEQTFAIPELAMKLVYDSVEDKVATIRAKKAV